MTDLATLAEKVATYPRASFVERTRSRLVAAASRTARSAAGLQTGRNTSPTTTRTAAADTRSTGLHTRCPRSSSSASTNHQK